MSSAFKNKLIISFAVLLVTSFCLYFFLPGSEYFIAGLIVIYFAVVIHCLQIIKNSKYSEFIEKNLGYLRLVEIIFIGILYFLWPSDYDQMMSAALKIRDAHPEQKIFDGEVEPPMPNKTENNITMTGVDSNKNGIRDDVDIWINRTVSSYNERMAFRQYSRVMTFIFHTCALRDKKNIELAFSRFTSARACIIGLDLDVEKNSKLLINNTNRSKCLDFYRIVGSDSLDNDNVNSKNGKSLKRYCKFDVIQR